MSEVASLGTMNHEEIERTTNDMVLNNKEASNQMEGMSTHSSTHSATSSTTTTSSVHDFFSSTPNASFSSSTHSSSGGIPHNTVMNYAMNSSRTSVTSAFSEQLLDHSHLKPGRDASLLSYPQTINMYRENAKKTNNPNIQCEFANFIIEAAKQLPNDDVNRQGYLIEAEKLLKQLAVKGFAEAQYSLGKLYEAGLLNKKGKPELDKAFPLYVQASKHLHADASNRAANCYEHGLGCRANGAKAILFYKKAAALSHPGAMRRLGTAYFNGELGVTKNAKEGVKWYNRSIEAINADYPEALYDVAELYITGVPNVVYVDLNYAVSLLNQAAELGYAPAAFKLGECYEYGKLNCQPDAALSIHYYTIAAEKGHKEACFALTAWYLVGSPNVLPQSDEQAYGWAKRAADTGLPKAEYAMGYFTEVGIGCEKNPTLALQWYQKAANNGDKRAIQRLQDKTPQQKLPTEKKTRSSNDDCKIM
ncbi:uncharacterized protein BX663DRAFT_513471 [Cokeromyces recurvatus]|uniref:uncharacterized protein n=1 Tax=Cokeromyces recurvatus TaxID=90255 RepID=UPI00221FB31F|nr:uncharacterized protein BX663DRAFT_513471 [Cokeromyces recurvatus]KAI7901627.1 hypothetical protein BX663DRAFT_513471 [Cokeromyces recurvatus]